MCDKSFETQTRGIMKQASVDVTVRVITSGKYRRYAHLSTLQHFRHWSIMGRNFIDLFKVVVGFFQSLGIILRTRPDVVFAKGGFVCVPVGMAAWCLRVPVVIHDSDVRPGLANKLLARFATAIATGFPLENYTYPVGRSTYTGVPIAADFRPVSDKQQAIYKKSLGYSANDTLVLAFGGGLGSVAINDAAIALAHDTSSQVLNITGKDNIDEARHKAEGAKRYRAEPFIYGLHDAMAAADIVVTRASATALQELAGIGKPVIAIPARQLGDQQQNAKLYENANAVVVLQDSELASQLTHVVTRLESDKARRTKLAHALHAFAKPDAATKIAHIIVQSRS